MLSSALYLLAVYPTFFAVGLPILVLSLIAFIVGIAKLKEPNVIFELDDLGMTFFHAKGDIKLLWKNIQRIDIPKIKQIINGNIHYDDLPYIGFKLKELNSALSIIGPRLAMSLYSNQKQLLTLSLIQNEHQDLLEKYLTQEFSSLDINNQIFTGIKAMFGHRCLALNEELGFHLYLPIDGIDRDVNDFVRLLRNAKNTPSSI